jgi:hypothetical protein
MAGRNRNYNLETFQNSDEEHAANLNLIENTIRYDSDPDDMGRIPDDDFPHPRRANNEIEEDIFRRILECEDTISFIKHDLERLRVNAVQIQHFFGPNNVARTPGGRAPHGMFDRVQLEGERNRLKNRIHNNMVSIKGNAFGASELLAKLGRRLLHREGEARTFQPTLPLGEKNKLEYFQVKLNKIENFISDHK